MSKEEKMFWESQECILEQLEMQGIIRRGD